MAKKSARLDKPTIQPADGKLLILLQGLGAVATTTIAGVELVRRKKAKPIGSLTQMGTVRIGRRDRVEFRPIQKLVPLAQLDDIEFAAWDILKDDALTAAKKAGVLTPEHLAACADYLAKIKPLKGVHDPNVVRRLHPDHIIDTQTPKREQADILREDIRQQMKKAKAKRAVAVMVTSTEVHQRPRAIHSSLKAFEKALDKNDKHITPTQLYAYACLREGVPFANGTPNLALQTPAFRELARETGVCVAGRDLKTGQTMMKTALAPALKARMLGLDGWYSANILGNRDGEVLDDPEAFRSKEETKSGVLDTILQPKVHPDLYGHYYHKVRINYYPPRGDNKEGWDNIDIFGWLGYPMQIKVDFLCRDSILAAPIVLDLALFLDLAQRAGWRGTQEWLSFYFKEPMTKPNLYPEHNLFTQLEKLENTLRHLAGEELITHLGLDYYADDLAGPNQG